MCGRWYRSRLCEYLGVYNFRKDFICYLAWESDGVEMINCCWYIVK